MSENEWTKILGWPGYRVYRSEINEATKTLRLWVRRKRGNRKLECSGCGRRINEIAEVQEREVRALPRSEYRTTVVIELYRVRCPDGGIKAEKVALLPSKPPSSKRFEEAVRQACESAAVRRVARQFGLAASTVRAIDLRYLERWAQGRRRPSLRQMGVDEIYLGGDPAASKYVDGTAFHLYGGETSVLTQVHDAYPKKNLYMTEQSVTAWPGEGRLGIAEPVSRVMIGATRNWSRSVLLWNLAADPQNRPHTNNGGCTGCSGAITLDGDSVTKNIAYYVVQHFSPFVPPGSVRVASSEMEQLASVAFLTPEGKVVLVGKFSEALCGQIPRKVLRKQRYPRSQWELMSGRRVLQLVRRWGFTAGLLAATVPAPAAKRAKPEFGPNVLIFDPSMPAQAIQKRIDAVYATQEHNEFGPQRNALLFLPGSYSVDVPVGFYTEVMGLGASPDATRIAGNVHADANHEHNNATTTFWRAAEGFSVVPASGTMQWAVSQAVSLRRMHVRGDLVLHQKRGWASGGWVSDSLVDGNVDSGSQQQWISRNCDWKSWTGANWNMVFVGVVHPPEGAWPSPPYTKVAQTPVVREKPFLQVNAGGEFSVRVPELHSNSVGITWRGGETAGETIPLAQFYIAHPDVDTAETINAQLAQGKHLILTPGIYELIAPIRVTRPHTVVLGLGFATLHPVKGAAAMTTADADGIEIAGLLFDAGPSESPVLLEVGPEGSRARHAKDPIALHDVFFRVGGAGAGRAKVNLRINSNDTLVDHTWIWRADHGAGVGWELNTSENGLVLNGNEVTIYGLFVEHHQQFQVLWKGNGGRTYFYQSEIPYDPPNQASYRSALGVNGWASYKVADGVTSHEAWALGVYSVFQYPDVVLTRAIETPKKPEVRFHDMITVALGDHGEISHVIDDTGEATSMHPRVTPKVTNFP